MGISSRAEPRGADVASSRGDDLARRSDRVPELLILRGGQHEAGQFQDFG
jgi:hypothetical protein